MSKQIAPERQVALDRRLDRELDAVIDQSLKVVFSNADRVGPDQRHQLRGLLRFYAKKDKPFTACVHDNTKRFGPGRVDKVCLVGETPVDTDHGPVSIADLREGDLVWSWNEVGEIFELKPVTWSGLTRKDAEVVRIEVEDGTDILATPDHPFLRYNGIWQDASTLTEGNFLLGPGPGSILSPALAAVALPFEGTGLSVSDVLGPEMASGTDRIFTFFAASGLDNLVSRNDFLDLVSAPGKHPRFDYSHHGDSCMTVDPPVVSDFPLSEYGIDFSQVKNIPQFFEGLRGILGSIHESGATTTGFGVIPTESSLPLQKSSGPSDVLGRQITKVSRLKKLHDVWDIEVADNHSFVVHQISILHNCAVLKDLIRGTTHWRGHPELDHGSSGAVTASDERPPEISDETAEVLLSLGEEKVFDMIFAAAEKAEAIHA